jgi:hypothetical protein
MVISIYKVSRPGKHEWAATIAAARMLAAEYVNMMRRSKGNGLVCIDGYECPKAPSNRQKWCDFLNGSHQGIRRMEWKFRTGIVVRRTWVKQPIQPEFDTWDVTTHPKLSYAAWIDVAYKDGNFRELIARAPDPRSLFIAMKLAGYVKAHKYAITREITRYLWHWGHNVKMLDSDTYG